MEAQNSIIKAYYVVNRFSAKLKTFNYSFNVVIWARLPRQKIKVLNRYEARLASGFFMEKIKEIFKNKILVIDGAMGTMVQSYKLEENDFRGTRFKDHSNDLKGNNEVLSLTRPDVCLLYTSDAADE